MQSAELRRWSGYQTWDRRDDTSRSRIAFVVPKTLVKKIKDALEANGDLDKSVKIRPARVEELKACSEISSIQPRLDACFISTTLSVGLEEGDQDTLPVKCDMLQSLGLEEYTAEINLITLEQARDTHSFLGFERCCKDGLGSREASTSKISSMNPLALKIDHWLHQLPQKEPERPFTRDAVLSHRWTYMVYPPLLLLPPTTLSNLSSIFTSKGQSLPKDLSLLWYLLCREFKTSHIALNAPIPASVLKGDSFQAGEHREANILRSPSGLTSLHGDFGLALSLDHVPTITDLSSAFWCTARQNGIFQTWAPRYTMFSRGNFSEKARIRSLKTLTEKQLGSQPEETSAMDLYAGIGYFAFSYAQAGVGKVLCWEINPWSIEGLRRGAERNRWSVQVIKNGQASSGTMNDEVRLIVFQESNSQAVRRMAAMKDSIPPVRHVNCGLLPSSEDSWEIAVQVLDPTGGWIHAHENIAKKDIESRTEEIVGIFHRLVMNHRVDESEEPWRVECEHVEQVKDYAPGVIHYVLDISISPPG